MVPPDDQHPWLESTDTIVASLDTDPDVGLTSVEVEQRLARYGPNKLASKPPVPKWRKILDQFVDPLVILLLVAVVVSLVAWILDGAEEIPFEAIVITIIVVANAVLGYWQEAKAEQAVAALQKMAAAHATVIRDGEARPVETSELVPGDIMALAEGDAIGADGRLLEAATLKIAEAPLTGESESVLKSIDPLAPPVEIGDRVNMVFNGTAVASGRGRAVVTATGMASEMGRIASLLEEAREERTPLQREIDRVGKILGLAVVVIAVVIVATILATSEIETASDVVDVLLVGVSLAVAAVPEGLPAILSVVLALGVQRMATENAIVKRLSSVETLGSASVICSDKTGTLTKNEMTITRVVTGSGQFEVTGEGYVPEGEVRLDGDAVVDDRAIEEISLVFGGGSLASDASIRRDEEGRWVVQGDPTEAAFVVAENKLGLADLVNARFERVDELPFTSDRKLMTAVERDAERADSLTIITKGAPDVLLGRCAFERVAGRVVPLTALRRAQILSDVEGLADQALRTLAVAYRQVEVDSIVVDESIENDLAYLGTVGIIDPPRSEVADAIGSGGEAGIRVIMITGDHPRTAVRIAEQLSIVEPGDRVLTGLEINELDDEAFAEAVGDVAVYARVSPEHKLRIVKALHEAGNIVAMTGDGVNDAPALKEADIGVAMGITGTEVSKEAADMILADDNFATILAAVRQGRIIFSNIRKFLRYLLTSNMGEVLVMFVGVVFASSLGLTGTEDGLAVPLLATQILWINLLTDTAPAAALGVDPPVDDVMARRPRRLHDRVIDGEMQFSVVFTGAVMAAVTLLALDLGIPGGLIDGDGDVELGRTLAFTTLVLAQLFNAFNARSAHVSAFVHLFTNRLLWAAVAFSFALQIVVIHVPLLNDAFDTTPLAWDEWVICGVLASFVLWTEELRKLVVRAVLARRPQPRPGVARG